MSGPGSWAALALVCLAACATAVLAYGHYRWNEAMRHLRDALTAQAVPIIPARVDFASLAGLPAPVQRYLRLVLVDGAPVVAGVRIRQIGSMKLSQAASRWTSLTADQQVVTQRAGFGWNARIAMLPGVHVLVRDSYVAGEGALRAAVFGLFTVAELGGTVDMAQGELMRFLAEAVWYPTALLPGHGVSWTAIDAQHARATLIDGAHTVSLVFRFDQHGLVEGIRADARGRAIDGKTVPTSWSGRFWGYRTVGTMLVPRNGEVAWELPEGLQPYWRGEVQRVVYAFAQ
ncbi:hypothetical protein IV454_17795 [Massilia antarctica]|uniref:Uncharacterized protein n=1 Tax=Massilia antarctica TaxID=2765360 RepID=A0AA48W9R3_9BURK|nr:DUF6544 family protein [Massilia antarctica]QPI47467.1 hypothetical protein IV454_17795 [Massilia antarctica]